MYKHVACLVRRPDMTHDAFVDYWRSTHSPIARDIEGVVRYQTVEPVDPSVAEFDGIAELYFESLEALHAALGSEGERDYDPELPVATQARVDVDNFLDVEGRPRLIGEETVHKDDVGGQTDGLYKHVACLVRRPDMTYDTFVDYWRSTHTPIAREIEGVVRYATVVPTQPSVAEFDGIAELYFESLEALHAALGSEGERDYDPELPVATQARVDVDNFLDVEGRPRLIGRERLIVDRT